MNILKQINDIYDKHEFPFYTKGDYNLNLFGIRTLKDADAWNDLFGLIYKVRGSWRIITYIATTDPGKYWLAKPMKSTGTAVLCEGYHKGLWQLGRHKGRYQALTQKGIARVYRDNNKDNIIDIAPESVEKGYYGINCHRASMVDEVLFAVGKWSAGCQVIKHADNFNELMSIANISVKKWGDSLSYALFTDDQFNVRLVA